MVALEQVTVALRYFITDIVAAFKLIMKFCCNEIIGRMKQRVEFIIENMRR